MFVFLKLLVAYGAMVLICTGVSSFTHYCFCIFGANVNILKKTNNALVLLWKWWLFHGHYLTLRTSEGPLLDSLLFSSHLSCFCLPSSSLWLCIYCSFAYGVFVSQLQNLICHLISGLYFISEKLTSCLLSWFNHSVFCASVPFWAYIG